jgi:tetratricopeptide (TPR) repeat protein
MLLYKYFSPDRLDVLRDGFIRLTQLGALNDPFECSPRLLEPNELPDPPHAQCQCCVDSYVAGAQEHLLQEQATRTGVVCLTEHPDNLLMWAHYAQNHEGFVVGFDTTHAFFADRPAGSGLRRVKYQLERPALPRSMVEEHLKHQPRINPHGFVNVFVSRGEYAPLVGDDDYRLVKSREWEYEGEWRLVLPVTPPYRRLHASGAMPVYLVPFPMRAVRTVILGCRSFSALYPQISQIIEDQSAYAGVEIVSASRAARTFQLELEPFPFADRGGLGTDATAINEMIAAGVLVERDEAIYRDMKDNDDRPADRMPSADRPPAFEAAMKFVMEELLRFAPDRLSRSPRSADTASLSAEEHLWRYAEARSRKDLPAATAHLTGALDSARTRAEGLYLAGLFHKNVLKDMAFAQALLEGSLLEDPAHVEACYSLGNLYKETGRAWDAEAAYRTALAASPQHAKARTNLGTVQLSENRCEEAQRSFEIAIADDPTCFEAHFNLASVHIINGQDDTAATQIGKGMVATSGARRVQCFVTAVRLLAGMGDDPARMLSLTRAVGSQLQDRPNVLFLFALTSRVAGQDRIAVLILQQLLELGEDLPACYAALAHSFARLGNEGEWRRYRDLLEGVPNRSAVLQAALHVLDGDSTTALECLIHSADQDDADIRHWAAVDPLFDGLPKDGWAPREGERLDEPKPDLLESAV